MYDVQDEEDITGDYLSPRRSVSIDSLDNLLEELDPLHESRPVVQPEKLDRYEDLTSIDWIQEFAAERQRKLALAKDMTVNGRTIRIIDQAQTWIILAATGVLVGILAGSIDIVSLYLGDLKEGHCSSAFYLSKSFCCWGLTEDEVCYDWKPWSTTLHVSSAGGGYLINYLFYCCLAAVLAASASILSSRYAPYASHSGIPEIKVLLSGVVIKRFLGKMTLIVKSIGLCLAVSSGLWLGKEGPLVHCSTCCGSVIMKLFPSVRQNEARKREIFSAASAAGMSVAFGSPIGGVLFALEQISYYFPDRSMWQSFVCAMISSVSLQFMNPFRTGKLVLYQVVFDRDWHRFELIPFAFLGVIGGLYGAYFIKLNRLIQYIRRNTWIHNYPCTEVAMLAMITSVISFPNVFTRIPASRVLTDLLQECSQGNWLDLCTDGHLLDSVLLLLSAAVLGSILSAWTFGAKIPAGIILPSMTVGAALGRAVGMLCQHWHRSFPSAWIFASCASDSECVTPGVYAIVGAAAALSGVTRMTISLVVIMFELTGALTYVLPIMVAVMTAKFVGDSFGKQGIYESWIELQGYPYLDKNEESLHGVSVDDMMVRVEDLSVLYLSEALTIRGVMESLRTNEYEGFPVLSDKTSKILLGYIMNSELRTALSNYTQLEGSTRVYLNATTRNQTTHRGLSLQPYIDRTPFILSTGSSARLVINLFQRLGLRYVFFGRHGSLVGMVSKKDLINIERAIHANEDGC